MQANNYGLLNSASRYSKSKLPKIGKETSPTDDFRQVKINMKGEYLAADKA